MEGILFDSSFYLLKSSSSGQKIIFYTVTRLSRKLIASKIDCKRRGSRGGF